MVEIDGQMRIAIFIPTIRSGGAEKQACLLAKSLAAYCDVSFISFYGKENAEIGNLHILESEPRINFVSLAGSKPSKLCQLYNVLKHNEIDCIFNYLTFCDFFGALIGRAAGVKRIVGGIRNSRLPFAKNLVERFIHNHVASETVFNSRSGADYFAKKGYCRGKMTVIHNCFENVLPYQEREAVEKKRIISVGRFVEQKDYGTALSAVKALSAGRNDFVYRIVGYGPLECGIRKRITEMDLEDFVEVIIRPSDIPELLKRSDIYLSSSIFEGTSNSIMEALNASLPVVATDVGDNYLLVENGVSGMLHPTKDFESIASSLDMLLDNHEMRCRFGKRANCILAEKFSVERFTEAYLNLLKK